MPGVGKSLATFITVLHHAKKHKRNFVWVNLPTGRADINTDMKVFIRCYETDRVTEGHSLAFAVPYSFQFFMCIPPKTFLVVDGLKCATFLDEEVKLGRFKHIERVAFVHSGPAKSLRNEHKQYWGAPSVRMYSWNLIDYEDTYVRAKHYNVQQFMVLDLAATSKPWAKVILKREILHSGLADKNTFSNMFVAMCNKPVMLEKLMSELEDFFRWVLIAKLYHAGGCPHYMFKRRIEWMLALRTEFKFQMPSDNESVNLGGSINVKHSYSAQYHDGEYMAVSEFIIDHLNIKGENENPHAMLSVFKASYKHGIKLGQQGYAGNAYKLTVIYYLKSEQANKAKDNVAIMRPNFQEMTDRLKMNRTPNVHFVIHSIERYIEAAKINVESITSQVALGKGVLLVPMKTNNAGFDLIHVAHKRKLSTDEVKAAELNMPESIPLRVTFLQLTVAEKQHSANFRMRTMCFFALK